MGWISQIMVRTKYHRYNHQYVLVGIPRNADALFALDNNFWKKQ
jgi:hypothetical protein